MNSRPKAFDSSESPQIPSVARIGFGLRIIPVLWNVAFGILLVWLVNVIIPFTAQELSVVAWLALPAVVIGAVLSTYFRDRRIAALAEFIQLHEAGEATLDDFRAAFEVVVNLPRNEVILGLGNWILFAVPIASFIFLLTDTFSPTSVALILAIAISAGCYAHTIIFFHVKRFLAPLRAVTASGIPESGERAALVRDVSVHLKLALVLGSLIASTTFISVSMGQTRLLRATEGVTTGVQAKVLEELRGQISVEDGGVDPPPARPIEANIGVAHFLVVDREEGEVVRGDESLILAGELRAILDTGEDVGDSVRFHTPHSFSWTVLPDDRHLLVAVNPDDEMFGQMRREGIFILVISTVAVFFAMMASRAVSGDLTHSMEVLRERTERIGSGDLQGGIVFESEDDVGTLARSIDRMSDELRRAIGAVAASADEVETVASEIVEASRAVSTTSNDQGQGIRDVTQAMQSMNQQARGIGDSSRELDASVEGSSQSVEELVATGLRLSESGEHLGVNLEQVVRVNESMFQRISEVRTSSTRLSQAADGTNDAMERMAAALRDVDANASETARLSDAAQASAEAGRSKVRATIDGIDSIRSDTELVGSLVGDLSARSEQIGQIVEVISSVADETNLLALNAAIIAAQAGEHGRGFSVVAGEIKALAQRVFGHTKEIADLIASVQEGASAAVGAIERTRDSVHAGVSLSESAGAVLDEIAAAAVESRSRMAQVVTSVRQQSEAASHIVELTSQVRAGVGTIEEIASQQTQSTEEVLESTRSMGEAATMVQSATTEQQRSSQMIVESVECVREATAKISSVLDEHSASVKQAITLLARLHEYTSTNESSNERMGESASSLIEEAAKLRDGIRRFRL